MSSVGHEHMRRLMVSWLFTMRPWENLRSWGVSWTHDKISKLRASHGSHDITKRSLSSSCDCVLIHPTPTMRASHGSHDDPTWPWGVSWALGQIFKVAPPTPTMRASHGSHGYLPDQEESHGLMVKVPSNKLSLPPWESLMVLMVTLPDHEESHGLMVKLLSKKLPQPPPWEPLMALMVTLTDHEESHRLMVKLS